MTVSDGGDVIVDFYLRARGFIPLNKISKLQEKMNLRTFSAYLLCTTINDQMQNDKEFKLRIKILLDSHLI